MSVHIYQSQSIDYFNRLGKYCLASLLHYLPQDFKITVTTEDYDKFPKLNPRINLVDLYSLDNGFKEFQDRWHEKTSGKVINFAKKGYTVLQGLDNCKEDIFIHIDADAYIIASLDENYFKNLIGNNLAAHLEIHGEEFVIESGFFAVNMNHPGAQDFASIYRDIYDNDRNEGMGKYYDGNVHGATVIKLKALGNTFNDLNLRHKGNTPFRGSKIEGKIGHFKGKVKLTAEEYYKQIGLANHVDKVFA